jgi:hypothetical protein
VPEGIFKNYTILDFILSFAIRLFFFLTQLDIHIPFSLWQAFEGEDAKADENIRSIREKDALPMAIEACVCCQLDARICMNAHKTQSSCHDSENERFIMTHAFMIVLFVCPDRRGGSRVRYAQAATTP